MIISVFWFIVFISIYDKNQELKLSSIINTMSTFQLFNQQNNPHHQDFLPKSSCSIEKNPLTSRRNVRFNENDFNIPVKSSKKQIHQYCDRYLPMRKMPQSAKQLYQEHHSWQLIQQQLEDQQKQDHKGLSLADLYKMEVLGAQPDKSYKDKSIDSFSNNNLLKFNNKGTVLNEKNVQQSFSSKYLVNIPEDMIPNTQKVQRKISKVPAKVLDAPALYDDFYLNLVDWSASNVLAVGLSNSVYLWNASNSKVVRLVELGSNDLVTSTSWSASSNVLAVGTHSGQVQLWDVIKNNKFFTYQGHTARVGAISWNSNNVFASGSRDKTILIRDIRKNSDHVNKMVGHRQQVCGLKWSFDQQQLASGGNDNRLNIWSMHSSMPVFSLLKHTAAVKALAWSPHQHGLLVTGGGTADRTIRFWNSVSGQQTQCLDVGSQVCNLMFSKNVNELVSTHGYSLNQINIWKMPKMQKIETLTGHTYRVLYLAMSPDGTTIVTGAGDQTLRFWNVFPKKDKVSKTESNLTADAVMLR